MDIYEQQGQDITASDMVQPEEDSDIKNFFNGSCIFITGATGFLGKLALEKLLRTCTGVKKIFVLIRAKKGKDIKQRLDDIVNEPSYSYLQRNNPNFKEKIHIMTGDICLPDLGLSEIEKATLIQEVDCIMHYAATVRFDEKLRVATYINVRAVRDLIRIAKQMKKLRAFLHVSTAYSNCIHHDIDEIFYDPPITGDKLLNLVECLNDNQLEAITKSILNDFPNTYVFTKCVAEDILKKEGKNLPIALYRPSIVIATAKEPIVGWIDNIYGPTGVFIGVAVGLVRSLYGNTNNKADMVPADYVINSSIASMWDIATIKSLNKNKEIEDSKCREDILEKNIPIYNYVSSSQNPITWNDFEVLCSKYAKQIPSEKVMWHYMFKIRSNYYEHVVAVFFLHTVPSYIIDFILLCLGKKPMLVKGYQKVDKFSNVIAYFASREWKFKNDNMQSLWRRMKRHDRELFEFNIENINWHSYFCTYVRGARVYILKDPLDTIPKGRIKYYKMMILHYTLLGFLSVLLLRFVFVILERIFWTLF